ncbi:ABC transporter permease [Rhodococcus sp. BP-241]|uniref:ABC transporter permease n=1 Tax=Rhodococcus sp. BP-241 TaxID=2739441 RepID=UPI0027E0A831|nr:ABC transporter permease [Rhodococcus sp. BP-241]
MTTTLSPSTTSGTSSVRNEFAKYRHLRLGVVSAALALGIIALTMVGMLGGAPQGEGEPLTWGLPLAGLSLALPLASPLLIAVIASRAVEIEHQGNGWLLARTSGVTPGRLCRAKFWCTAVHVVVATSLGSIGALALGVLGGISDTPPAGLWLGQTLSALVVALAVLALQVLVSARFDNQLVALGNGIVGTVVALYSFGLPVWAAHLTPWGYWSLIASADYQGDAVVTLTPSYGSVAVLAVLASVVFTLATRRLDRQEG